MNKSKPWYTQYTLWKNKANNYLNAYKKGLSDEQWTQLTSFGKVSIFKLIFESNTIEGSGTKTYGETERILEKITKKHQLDNPNFIYERTQGLLSIFRNADLHSLIVVKHEKSFREYDEVMQHVAALYAAITQNVFLFNNKLNKSLFSTDSIKKLHQTIAQGLLKEGQIPGKYRNFDDITIIGQDLTFPAHKLLPQAMEAFVERSNKLIEKGLNEKDADIFLIMAQITYEFVRIHPFPDFNGRLSRVLLQMIALTLEMPFCIVIKGNKKGRHRYIEALKRANAIKDYENVDYKHLEPYATLIAMSVVESFEEIDNNLKLAGLKTIL
jgi:fido (protein-threonine AMPylation protein)